MTQDVPDYALMAGCLKQIGWVCECGLPLKDSLHCQDCGREYVLVQGQLQMKPTLVKRIYCGAINMEFRDLKAQYEKYKRK